MIKNNFFSLIISVTIFCFIFSLQFNQIVKYNVSNFFFITLTDFFFILLFFYCFIIFLDTKFSIFLNYIKLNYLDYFFMIILLISIIKIVISSFEIENIIETIKRTYLFCVYLIFKILLNFKNKKKIIIVSSFICISIFSSVLIFFSYIYFNYTSEPYLVELWTRKENIVNPVFTNPVHYRGFFQYYNMQCYIIIPGFLFLISHYYAKNNKSLVIFFSFLCLIILYLIKSKILLIFIFIVSPTLYFLFYNNNFIINKKFFLIYFFISLIIYFVSTNILFIKENVITNSNKPIFDFYYTSYPLINFFNYDIYGSIFFKLKYLSLLIAKENFFFFNELYFEFFNFKNYSQNSGIIKIIGMEPHSLLFGSLANYGLIGCISYMLFYFYPIFSLKNSDNYNLIIIKKTSYNLVALFFLIESFNSDINNLIFLMVIYSLINNKNLNT